MQEVRKTASTTVLLIRHGEKHSWLYGQKPEKSEIEAYTDDHLLSCKGYERAMALIPYFTQRKEITHLLKSHPLQALFAQDVDEEGKGKSERPRDTIAPLSQHLGIPVQLYKKKETEEMIRRIISGEYEGESVVVCWAHQDIPKICRGLGVEKSNVPSWPKERYDLTWAVHIEKDQATLTQIPQRLLYGDLDTV